MSEPPDKNEAPAKAAGEVTPAKSGATNPSAPGDQSPPGELTKEEQWALFEKELKESDWGHQPC